MIYFICTRPFNQKLGSLWIYSFFSEQPFDQKLGSSLISSFHLQTTFRQKYMILFHLFFSLYTTIGPKSMVLIELFLLFAHDYSTKTRGHSYSSIYIFLSCASISFATFKAVVRLYFVRSISGILPLHFVHYIHSSISYSYVLYTVFMEVLLLYLERYSHGHMKSVAVCRF